MSFFLSLNRMKIVRILLFYYWISPLSANTFLAANTAFNTFGNPVYGIHCKNVSITFSGVIFMRIGEIAKAAGISEYTLRYYEKKGLIRVRRDDAGRRCYDESDMEWKNLSNA